MTVRYTPKALAELRAILDFIDEQSPSGARRVQQRIKAVADLLSHFPQSGQLTSVDRLRRVVVTPFPYVIFYRADAEVVVIVSVRHTARESDFLI